MQFTATLLIILGGFWAVAPSFAEQSLEFSFDAVEMEAPDLREKASHERSSLNLRCELVEFDFYPIVDLINKIDSRRLGASDTAVFVRFFDRHWLKFVGISAEVNSTRPGSWPRVWYGTADEGKSSVMFVIQSTTIARAHITRTGVVYALYPSTWSENSFLCKRDPDFRGRKID